MSVPSVPTQTQADTREKRQTHRRTCEHTHARLHARTRTHARTHAHTYSHSHSLTHSLTHSLSLSLSHMLPPRHGDNSPETGMCVRVFWFGACACVGACVCARACHACVQPADLESSQAVQAQQKIHSAQGLLAGSQVRRGRQCHDRRCRIIPSPPPPRPPDRPNLDRISCRRRGQHDDRGGEKEVLPASRD